MFCRNCGRMIPDQMKVCGYCGTPVDPQDLPQDPATPQSPYESQAPQSPYESQAPQSPYESQAPQSPYDYQSPQGPYDFQEPVSPQGNYGSQAPQSPYGFQGSQNPYGTPPPSDPQNSYGGFPPSSQGNGPDNHGPKKSKALWIILACVAAVAVIGILLFLFRGNLFHKEKEKPSSGHLIQETVYMPIPTQAPHQPEESLPEDTLPENTSGDSWIQDPTWIPQWVEDSINEDAVMADYDASYEGVFSYECKGEALLAEVLESQEDASQLIALDNMFFDATALCIDGDLDVWYTDLDDDDSSYWLYMSGEPENGVYEESDEYTEAGYHVFGAERVYFLDDGSLYVYAAEVIYPEVGEPAGIVMRGELSPVASAQAQMPAVEEIETRQTPTLDEFDWYEQVRENGIGDNVQFTEDFEDTQGCWKGCVIADPDRIMDCYSQELVNIEVGGPADATKFVFLPHTIYWDDGTTTDSSVWGPYEFAGSYENGEYYLTGEGNLTVSDFWYVDGKQYALGYLTMQDGTQGEVAMMRP